MTDKLMAEKKKEFEDLISVELQEWYRLGLHDGFRIDDDMLLAHKEMVEGVIKKQPSTEIWDFIEKLVEEVERSPEEEHRHNWVMTSHESFPFPQFTCPDCGMRKETSKYSITI